MMTYILAKVGVFSLLWFKCSNTATLPLVLAADSDSALLFLIPHYLDNTHILYRSVCRNTHIHSARYLVALVRSHFLLQGRQCWARVLPLPVRSLTPLFINDEISVCEAFSLFLILSLFRFLHQQTHTHNELLFCMSVWNSLTLSMWY